jgi:hemerythrin-like metal-binding protein
MKWNSSFAIGIEAIDMQHRKIFELLLSVENSLVKRDPWHILRFHLSQLAEYMKFHLAVEESLLEVACYPDLHVHREQHTRIVNLMEELENKLQHDSSGENVVRFFEDWFLRHVLSSDRDYAAYFREEFPVLCGRQQV